MSKMKPEQIEEMRGKVKLIRTTAPFLGVPGTAMEIINDVPDLLDAQEKAQSFSAGVLAATETLHKERERLQAENERLREAAKDAATICRFQRKTSAHEAQDVEKAQAAWTRWIEKFEALAQGSEPNERENAGDWNYALRTCAKCGALFKRIEGVWVGEHTHRGKCPTLKGGD